MNKFHKVPSDLISIGKISKAHGLAGEVKVFLYNGNSESLNSDVEVWLDINNEFKNFKISYIKNNKFIKFKNVNDRNQSEILNGKLIYLSRSKFPKLEDNQFYLSDLIGFEIKDLKDVSYGIVLDVIQLPTNDSILFEYENKEVFIPIIDDFVKLFDFENKTIFIKNHENFISWWM